MYAQKKRGPVGGVRGGRQMIQRKSGTWERVERLQPRDMAREKMRRTRLWTAEIGFRRLGWMGGSGRWERRKVRKR